MNPTNYYHEGQPPGAEVIEQLRETLGKLDTAAQMMMDTPSEASRAIVRLKLLDATTLVNELGVLLGMGRVVINIPNIYDGKCGVCNRVDIDTTQCAGCYPACNFWHCGQLTCLLVHYREHHPHAVCAAITFMTESEQRRFLRLLEYVR